MTRESRPVFIGFGSNFPNRLQMLRRAAQSLIDVHPTLRIPIVSSPKLSSMYETEIDDDFGPSVYLCAVMVGETTLSYSELLAAKRFIEDELRKTSGPQTFVCEIHMDVLIYHDQVFSMDSCMCHAFMCAMENVRPGSAYVHDDSQIVRQANYPWFVDRSDDTSLLIPMFTEEMPSMSLIAETMNTFGALRFVYDDALNVQNETERLRHLVSQLFDLPGDALMRCLRDEDEEGYTPPGVEAVRGHVSDKQRHFFDIRSGKNAALKQEVPVILGAVETMMALVLPFCFRILQAMDQSIHSEPDRSLADDANGGAHLFRVGHYLNHTASPLEILFPSHKDFGLLTAYIGGSTPGLQMKLHGVWHDVYNPPGSVIFAAGTTLRMLCPHVPVIPHRVTGGSIGRISISLFTELRPEVLLPNGKTNGEQTAAHVRTLRAPHP